MPISLRAVNGLGGRAAWMLLILGCFCTRCAAPAPAGPAEVAEDGSIRIQDLLPAPGRVAPWTPSGESQVYEGEDLFIYINGGAELFYEFGFKQVLVQEYTASGDQRLTLEIYEMQDNDAAYGIYSFRISDKGSFLDLGDEGCLDAYYLNFRKARYLVTLTALDDGDKTRQGLEQIARAVDERIPLRGGEPRLVSLLSPSLPESCRIRYFVGPLGLFNSGFFCPQAGFPFQEGMVATVRTGFANRFSLFRFEGKEECSHAIDLIREKSDCAGGELGGLLSFISPDREEFDYVVGKQIGPYLLFGIEVGDDFQHVIEEVQLAVSVESSDG